MEYDATNDGKRVDNSFSQESRIDSNFISTERISHGGKTVLGTLHLSHRATFVALRKTNLLYRVSRSKLQQIKKILTQAVYLQ